MQESYSHMGATGHAMWGMHWAWWLILVLLLLAVLLWAVGRRRREGAAEPSPLEQLEKRYAAGELSTQDYEERKRHLQG